MEQQTAIETQNLSVGYEGRPALKNVSLSVRGGDLLALLGPNGSGKTTLLKVLLGILAPDEGTVLLHNKVLQAYPPKERAKKIAYVSQQPPSSFPLTVFELVSLGRYPYSSRFGRDTEDAMAAEEALALTHASALRDRRFNTLSGGEKQKILLSRAMAQSMRILLLDEPTVHLDLYYQLQILKTLKKLCRERGTTVIAVLHEMNLVSLFADQVVLLRAGKVHAFGTVPSVLTEKNIEEVFGVTMAARQDAATGARYFVPRDPVGFQ